MEHLKTQLDLYPGEKKTLLLPGGYQVIIREQNAKDDETLSNVLLAKDVSNINLFITDIIVYNHLTNAKQTLEDTVKMRLRDKYFVLIASRIFSLSQTLKFEYDWNINGKKPVKYEEDLNLYLWDYTKPIPKEEDQNYFQYRIKPYPDVQTTPEIMTLELEIGEKKYLIDYLNGYSESELVKLTEADYNINSELKARNFRTEDGKTVDLKALPAKVMVDIRRVLSKVDDKFEGLSDITNPYTGKVASVPLLGIHDFFYPTEI